MRSNVYEPLSHLRDRGGCILVSEIQVVKQNTCGIGDSTSWEDVICHKDDYNCIAGSCISYIRLPQSQKTMQKC